MSFIQQFFTSRDNNANAETFVGQEGRLWWNPETNQIYSSDGNTPGGIPLAGGGGGNGTPGGSNSQVQFNQNGSFGGTANVTIDRVTGALTAVSFVGNGVALTSITGANVTGIVANAAYADSAGSATTATGATTAGTVTTNAQPNITSVGTLTSVTVTGNISTTGNVVGNYILGNGSQLTGLSATYSNANVAAYLPTYPGNLVALTGNVITTANIRSGNLSVVGSINLGGQVTATGNVTGGNLLTGAAVSATGNVTGGNIVTGGVITTVSNVVANYFVGNGAALVAVNGSNVTGTVANATYATSAGTVTTAAQPNITSVGTLTSLSSTGNISGNYFIGNGSLLTGIAAGTYGNTNVATYLASGTNSSNIVTTANISAGNISGTHYGNGTGLSSITAANVIGTVGAANVANVATFAITANSASFADQATYVYGNGVVGQVAYAAVANSVAGANISGAVANATYATTAGTAYSVSAANVSGTVANATYALSANSASSLVNGSAAVLLNSDGTMVFPSNIINTGANVATLWSTNSSSLLWRSPTGGGPGLPFQTTVSTNSGNATIVLSTGTLSAGSVSTWTFNSSNIVFPDTTVQTTAYPGTASSFSVTGNITGGNVIGTTGVSVGGTGGDLTMTGGAITGVGNITSNGIVAINAPGGITTTSASFDIVNATATTVNLGGSASNVNIGATTGTLTINNPNIVATQSSIAVFNTTATTANIFGAASTIIMGAAGAGTLTLRNGTIVGTQATINLFNTVSTTVNFAGAANTLAIAAGATPSGTTKTISIGENGVANSITNINFGTATGNGNVTFSANTLVKIANTSGTALSVTGNIIGGNILGGANVNATTHTGTTVSVAGNINGGNLLTTGAVYSNYNTNTANTGSFMATGGNTKGGAGYLDFLVAQNTSGGATNPYKWFRTNSTGGLEIINSAYTATIFNLTDAGGLSLPGPVSISGKQAVNGPAFRAYIDTNQAITSGSQQKVTFNGETFDTNSNFASSRFTPTVEGYYQLNATVRIGGISGTGEGMITIWKNGSEYARGHNESGTEQGASFYSMQVSDLAYANGTTDYFEIYIQQGSGSNKDTTAGTNISYFSGAMVRGA